MTIHKGNIEAFLLDYLEGNLDALLTAELMAFLSENPEYEKWIPEYDGHLCLETGPVYEAKLSLKKDFKDVPQIDENNFDEFCIASGEGLLEEKDQSRLNEYLSLHTEKQIDFDRYGKSVLQPDYLLVYPDKKALKKRGVAVIPLRYVFYALGAAASIAILLMIGTRKPAETVITAKPAPTHELPAAREEKAATSLPVEIPAGKEPESPIKEEATTENIPDSPPLAVIEPIRSRGISSSVKEPGIHKTSHPAETAVIFPEPPEAPAPDKEKTPARLLGSVVKKLNLWKAAETAVSGFNYLTESRLSLVRTTDENGKFSSLTLQSEEELISGNKVK